MQILTVDDSSVMRQMVRATLESAGAHHCLEAVDGREALSLLEKEIPDLIITDLHMPHINGIELTRRLRASDKFRHTPIVLLTTERGSELQQQGKDAGASGWMVKPFNPEKLLQVVGRFSV